MLIGSIKNNEDLKKYFLVLSEIGQHLKDEIDLQVADGELNDGRVRHQLDSQYK